MDASLQQLLPRIKEALSLDAPLHPLEVPSTVTELLPSIRVALANDDVLLESDDRELAERVATLLPKLDGRIAQAYEDTRARLSREAPWALTALEWETDLLGVVGRGRSETLHTQCLAYLLDPKGAHGLGVRALREFFWLLGRLIPGEDSFELLSKETVENEQRLRTVRVGAEEIVESTAPAGPGEMLPRRCDVWMELVEEGRSLYVVIENKIDAGEHGDQLSAYEGAVWHRARSRRHMNFEGRLVFLTPDGRPPGDAADKSMWTCMSYRQLAAALARAARDAPEPGRSVLLLYVASILHQVLRIPSNAVGVERARQLGYMNEVLIREGTG